MNNLDQIQFNYSNLPPQLVQLNRFVLWKLSDKLNAKTGRYKKPPIDKNGVLCNAQDPKNWLSFDDALALYKSGVCHGIGFVLGAGISCLDVDNVSSNQADSEKILNTFKDITYTETSQSKNGYHAFFIDSTLSIKPKDRNNIQLYSDGQYIALTGNGAGQSNVIKSIDFDSLYPLDTLANTTTANHSAVNHSTLWTNSELLERAFKAKNGDKIRNLYESSSNSEDDLALASMLKFYTHGNCGGKDEQLTNLLKNAPVFESIKKRHAKADDYILRTVSKAKSSGFYNRKLKVIGRIEPKKSTDESWMKELLTTQSGNPKSCVFNIATILNNDSDWHDVIGYNKFTGKIEKINKPPYKNAELGEWDDFDDIETASYLSGKYRFSASTNHTSEAINSVSRNHQYHPVQDYLNSLKWDGKQRLQTWLTEYLGATANDERYPELIGVAWMISAVARVLDTSKKGVKVDTMLILEGEQGIGKSTALNTLAYNDDWFTDADIDVNSKDSYLAIKGKWIVEMAELDTLNRSEADTLKAFMTRIVDRYREPYGRRMVDIPRQCVFAGTGNKDEYLKDSTGARRFMPIYCTNIKHDELKADRNQLWAEAVFLYKAGHEWWFDANIDYVVNEHEKRFDFDVWQELVEEYLETKEQITTADLLSECLLIEASKQTKIHQMRVGSIMKNLEKKGWIKGRFSDKRGYYKL